MSQGSSHRSAVPADIPFIVHTWKTYVHDTQFSWSDPTEFHRFFLPRIHQLLEASKTLVACSDSDSDLIQGFIVVNGKTLHALYVKSIFRGMGIASGLLSSFPGLKQSSCWSPSLKKLNLKFNPRVDK